MPPSGVARFARCPKVARTVCPAGHYRNDVVDLVGAPVAVFSADLAPVIIPVKNPPA